MNEQFENFIVSGRAMHEAEELSKATGIAFQRCLESLYQKGSAGFDPAPFQERGLVGVKGPAETGGLDG